MEECWDQLFLQLEEEIPEIKDCCDNPNIIVRSQWVCTNCGIVGEPFINPKQDTQLYNNDCINQIRCNGTSNNHQDFSLDTIISKNGNTKSWMRYNYFQKETHKQRVVKELITKYNLLQETGCSQNILNSGISFFIDFVGVKRSKKEKIIIKGKKRLAMICICIYFAYKKSNSFRSKEELGKIFGVSSKEIEAAYEKYYIYDLSYIKNIQITNIDVIENYCVQFDFDFKKTQFIILMYSIFSDLNLIQAPMRPRSQILGLFYFILKEFGMPTEIITEKIKISKFTIEKVYKILLNSKILYFNTVKKCLIKKKFLK